MKYRYKVIADVVDKRGYERDGYIFQTDDLNDVERAVSSLKARPQFRNIRKVDLTLPGDWIEALRGLVRLRKAVAEEIERERAARARLGTLRSDEAQVERDLADAIPDNFKGRVVIFDGHSLVFSERGKLDAVLDSPPLSWDVVESPGEEEEERKKRERAAIVDLEERARKAFARDLENAPNLEEKLKLMGCSPEAVESVSSLRGEGESPADSIFERARNVGLLPPKVVTERARAVELGGRFVADGLYEGAGAAIEEDKEGLPNYEGSSVFSRSWSKNFGLDEAVKRDQEEAPQRERERLSNIVADLARLAHEAALVSPYPTGDLRRKADEALEAFALPAWTEP